MGLLFVFLSVCFCASFCKGMLYPRNPSVPEFRQRHSLVGSLCSTPPAMEQAGQSTKRLRTSTENILEHLKLEEFLKPVQRAATARRKVSDPTRCAFRRFGTVTQDSSTDKDRETLRQDFRKRLYYHQCLRPHAANHQVE